MDLIRRGNNRSLKSELHAYAFPERLLQEADCDGLLESKFPISVRAKTIGISSQPPCLPSLGGSDMDEIKSSRQETSNNNNNNSNDRHRS